MIAKCPNCNAKVSLKGPSDLKNTDVICPTCGWHINRKEPLREIENLEEVFEKHARWLGGSLSDAAQADLSFANLRNADFSNKDLRLANFKGSDVSGANFTGTNIAGADFRGARMANTVTTGMVANGIRVGPIE